MLKIKKYCEFINESIKDQEYEYSDDKDMSDDANAIIKWYSKNWKYEPEKEDYNLEHAKEYNKKWTEFGKKFNVPVNDRLINFSEIDDFIYNEYSETIRSKKENYLVASIKDGELVFKNNDAAVTGRIDKAKLRKMWKAGKISSK